jgi:hypothetical protein
VEWTCAYFKNALFRMCYLCINHRQDFLSLCIFLEVSWEKEEEMRRFEKRNACQSKWFVFGNTSLFVRDRICLITCPPNTLQKLCGCFMDLKLVGIGKDFLLINMFTCKVNKMPMMKC